LVAVAPGGELYFATLDFFLHTANDFSHSVIRCEI
jgi:hypothetical protein